MSNAPLLFPLPGLLLFYAVALASPVGAQLRSTQVQFSPVLVAPTCELTPTAGALRYSASAPGRISSDGAPGSLTAILSGATGSGTTASGPVIQFTNPTLTASGYSGSLPSYVSEMKIGNGSWGATAFTVPFPTGSGTLSGLNVNVQFQTTNIAATVFPAGTYSATVNVSCFESAQAGG